jgi:hypothetical protein
VFLEMIAITSQAFLDVGLKVVLLLIPRSNQPINTFWFIGLTTLIGIFKVGTSSRARIVLRNLQDVATALASARHANLRLG